MNIDQWTLLREASHRICLVKFIPLNVWQMFSFVSDTSDVWNKCQRSSFFVYSLHLYMHVHALSLCCCCLVGVVCLSLYVNKWIRAAADSSHCFCVVHVRLKLGFTFWCKWWGLSLPPQARGKQRAVSCQGLRLSPGGCECESFHWKLNSGSE